MSHFAVYAPTRNVGIDIVPLLPFLPSASPRRAARDCSPGIPGAIFLFLPPLAPALSRISDFAKFLQAGRVIAPPSAASTAPECQACILFWQRYILRSRLRGAHVERDHASSFISDSYDFNHYFSTIRGTTNATTNAIRVK